MHCFLRLAGINNFSTFIMHYKTGIDSVRFFSTFIMALYRMRNYKSGPDLAGS